MASLRKLIRRRAKRITLPSIEEQSDYSISSTGADADSQSSSNSIGSFEKSDPVVPLPPEQAQYPCISDTQPKKHTQQRKPRHDTIKSRLETLEKTRAKPRRLLQRARSEAFRRARSGARASRFIFLDRVHNGWRPRRPMTDPVNEVGVREEEGKGSGKQGIRDKLRKLGRTFTQSLGKNKDAGHD